MRADRVCADLLKIAPIFSIPIFRDSCPSSSSFESFPIITVYILQISFTKIQRFHTQHAIIILKILPFIPLFLKEKKNLTNSRRNEGEGGGEGVDRSEGGSRSDFPPLHAPSSLVKEEKMEHRVCFVTIIRGGCLRRSSALFPPPPSM